MKKSPSSVCLSLCLVHTYTETGSQRKSHLMYVTWLTHMGQNLGPMIRHVEDRAQGDGGRRWGGRYIMQASEKGDQLSCSRSHRK